MSNEDIWVFEECVHLFSLTEQMVLKANERNIQKRKFPADVNF